MLNQNHYGSWEVPVKREIGMEKVLASSEVVRFTDSEVVRETYWLHDRHQSELWACLNATNDAEVQETAH